MLNKSELQKEDPENSENVVQQTNQGIFDGQFSELTNQFGKICQENGISIGYIVAYNHITHQQFVFLLGHQFDVGRVMNKITNEIKHELHNELEDPSL